MIPRNFISPPGKRSPFYESPGARFAFELAIFHDHLSPRQHSLGDALHTPSFIRAVIHAHMMGRRADRLFAVRIEDHYIGVRADGNRALLRKQSKNLGCGGRSQFDEPVEADTTLRHAVVIDQTHAVLDSGAAVRDLTEIVAAQFLLLFEAEWTVVG